MLVKPPPVLLNPKLKEENAGCTMKEAKRKAI